MRVLARITISVLVFLAVYPFTFWVFFAQIFPLSMARAAQVAALLTAAVAAWWVWRTMRIADPGIFTTAAHWAAVAGAVGFCGGFFGPMIVTPGANQGPMLGLFITGPLGFVGGGLAGAICALWRRWKDRAVS
jgi:membrane associated rhomboid family serine protease